MEEQLPGGWPYRKVESRRLHEGPSLKVRMSAKRKTWTLVSEPTSVRTQQDGNRMYQEPIWRTLSLDGVIGDSSAEGNDGSCQLRGLMDKNFNNSSQPLCNSFDAAFLEDSCGANLVLRSSSSDEGMPGGKFAVSLHQEVDDIENQCLSDISGRKHLRQYPMESMEISYSDSVRKHPRHFSSQSAGSRTPVRSQMKASAFGAKKPFSDVSSTPSSTKRRRAPFKNQNKSPTCRHVPPSTPREGTQRVLSSAKGVPNFQQGRSAAKAPGDTQVVPLCSIQVHSAATPYQKTPLIPDSTMKLHSKMNVTRATPACSNQLETALETDSLETNSPAGTSFRFNTFPASLPRINNPRPAENSFHDSVRKRMSFAETALSSTHPANLSREDDSGTHNTSISSLSSQGALQIEKTDGQSLVSADTVHTKLVDEDYGYSDDDSSVSGPVGRTRLNFNLVLSPGVQADPYEASKQGNNATMQLDSGNYDWSHTYEHRKVNSFPSSISSQTPLRNLSGCDDVATASTAGLTPSRSGGGSVPLESFRFEHHRPETPQEVQLHFQQMDAGQCSPIVGIPEETEDTRYQSLDSYKLHRSDDYTKESSQDFSFSQNSESSSSSKGRRLRPMPDMAAFESENLTSSSAKTLKMSSPKLMCPPTPVRTPAWAHNESHALPAIHRSSSLTATRVLATCSPQALGKVVGSDGYTGNIKFSDCQQNEDRSSQQGETLNPVIGKSFQARREARFESSPSRSEKIGKLDSIISFASDFETLALLGRGMFADVYKVRCRWDGHLYAVKRNRRQFRGKRDRDMALAEVKSMQQLQNVDAERKSSLQQYLLFFYRAWQEDGHFFCQTELCCRDTCRELIDSLRTNWNLTRVKYPKLLEYLPPAGRTGLGENLNTFGRLLPESTVWKICHDVAAGLSHIHSHGLVHDDIKPSNIFLVPHVKLGALCKIGDFGMAACIGTCADGQEGDQKYMAPELLSSGVKHSSADVFSLGITLYELSADCNFELPSEGPRWHLLRSGCSIPPLPICRGMNLTSLVQTMMNPSRDKRPTVHTILSDEDVNQGGDSCDNFLREYVLEVDAFDADTWASKQGSDGRTPQNSTSKPRVGSPSFGFQPNTTGAAFMSPVASTASALGMR